MIGDEHIRAGDILDLSKSGASIYSDVPDFIIDEFRVADTGEYIDEPVLSDDENHSDVDLILQALGNGYHKYKNLEIKKKKR